MMQSSCKILSQQLRSRHSNNIRTAAIKLNPRCFHTSQVNNKNNVIESLLYDVKSGKLSVDDTQQQLLHHSNNKNEEKGGTPSDEDLDSFANLDHKRASRTGFPEAIFAAGKTPQQIATILDDMAANVNSIIEKESADPESVTDVSHEAILATRVDTELYEKISEIPLKHGSITYHKVAKIISMEASGLQKKIKNKQVKDKDKMGKIIVSCAGTTDLPVAEEAAITLEAAGCNVERVYDVGVAGLHRIINALPRLRHPEVDCVIVCAGMDGALPSVVAGLVSVPVVAVPTSIGYGASFNGISAMLTMLNSCAPGVGVVNIDNGFGGAALAFKCVGRDKR